MYLFNISVSITINYDRSTKKFSSCWKYYVNFTVENQLDTFFEVFIQFRDILQVDVSGNMSM